MTKKLKKNFAKAKTKLTIENSVLRVSNLTTLKVSTFQPTILFVLFSFGLQLFSVYLQLRHILDQYFWLFSTVLSGNRLILNYVNPENNIWFLSDVILDFPGLKFSPSSSFS